MHASQAKPIGKERQKSTRLLWAWLSIHQFSDCMVQASRDVEVESRTSRSIETAVTDSFVYLGNDLCVESLWLYSVILASC